MGFSQAAYINHGSMYQTKYIEIKNITCNELF